MLLIRANGRGRHARNNKEVEDLGSKFGGLALHDMQSPESFFVHAPNQFF